MEISLRESWGSAGTAIVEPWSRGCLSWRVSSPMDCLQVICKETFFSYDQHGVSLLSLYFTK